MESQPGYGTPLDGPVTADRIEEALAGSWRTIRASTDAGHPVARASVLSLIACVVERGQMTTVLDAIRGLSRQHPSRTIILLPDGDSSDKDIRVWHTTGCNGATDQDRMVCGEQIVVAAEGRAVSFLPSLSDQLMLTDLPSFLWWIGDLNQMDEVLFERLTALADRLIVDSSTFTELSPAFARIDRLAQRRHQPCAPSDLNWARLTPWRELVAQFFDSPVMRPKLGLLDAVSIEYDQAGGVGGAQALLLTGWLAHQLGWQPDQSPPVQDGDLTVHQFRARDGGTVSISRRPIVKGKVGGMVRVSLRTRDAATFVVAREDDCAHVSTEAEVAGVPMLRRIAQCEVADLSTLLANELVFFQRDHVFEAALRLVVEMSGDAAQRRA